MTRDNAKKLLPIITAFAEGKDVQSRPEGRETWSNEKDPAFHPPFEYRLKPEPMEIEVWVDASGNPHSLVDKVYNFSEAPVVFGKKKFREVID